MNSNPLRAAGMALLLGTASMAVATVVMTTTAEAAVRPAVGSALKAAISAAAAGRTSDANARLHEAESTPNLTGAEQSAIAQTRSYIQSKASGGGSGAKGKFISDYNKGDYRAAIADAEELRKAGQLDFNSQVVVAQCYYLLGDYSSAISHLKSLGDSEQVLELLLSSAYKSNDSATMRDAAEKLVLAGKTQYWANLLTGAENTRGLKDHQQLDLYRLRFATNNMRSESDYFTAAELALEFGSPAEAVNIINKGMTAKTLQGDRATRLLGLANAAVAKDNIQAAEAHAKTGDDLVKVGEDLTGAGKGQDALAQIQAGIAKGVSDKGNAQIRLGQANIAAGQKDAAVRAFSSAKDDPTWGVIAHIWSVYARTSK
jgi:tetratricopeptide (TPR) repeat protein